MRAVPIVLAGALAGYYTFVVANNVFDYQTNFAFVTHVLSMDSIEPQNPFPGRAITNPALQHAFYWVIIATEATAAVLCWIGCFCAFRCRSGPDPEGISIRYTTLGAVVGMTLFLFAFLAVGGEWFLMWMSETWNGNAVAFRMFCVNALVVVVLHCFHGGDGA